MTVLTPIVNRSSAKAVADFSIIVPDTPTAMEGMSGLNIEVHGSGQMGDIVRVAPDS